MRPVRVITKLLCVVAILFATMGASCTKEPARKGTEKAEVKVKEEKEDKAVTVYFVPLDDFSEKAAEKLSKEFLANFGKNQPERYSVGVMSQAKSPAACLNDEKSRYSATKLMKWLEEQYKDSVLTGVDKNGRRNHDYYIIGVTNKDIATPLHGSKDYGILGLSYLGVGKSSIISTRRLTHRKDLWKLATHEFCHGFYGCPHCKNDDPHCIMGDAKGGNPHFEQKDSFCDSCKAICQPKGK